MLLEEASSYLLNQAGMVATLATRRLKELPAISDVAAKN
jgi:hypothetical protein